MSTPLLENILAQPHALRAVGEHQLGAGRAALEHAAALIRDSRQIVITGMGASLFAAIPLPYALATLSAPVSIAECGELLHFLEKQIQPGAVLIIVSRSGESVEIVRLLDRVAGRSCRIIGITNTPGSTLARRSEVSLILNSPADQMVAIQTYTASVLLMALIAAAASGELDAAARDLHSSLPFFEAWVPELVAASPSWGRKPMNGL